MNPTFWDYLFGISDMPLIPKILLAYTAIKAFLDVKYFMGGGMLTNLFKLK